MKKTILHDQHKEILKAKMAPFAGFMMPLQYTSAKEEISAVRNAAGIFDVSHMGEFFITGEETIQFVDYIITNDYQKLPVGKAIYSPICNNDGNIIDDLIVYKLSPTKALICVNAANIEKDWNWIYPFTDKFNIKIENRSDEFSLIALQGPNSEKILSKTFPSQSSLFTGLPYYGVLDDEVNKTIFARTGYTGEDGFEIFCKNESVEAIWLRLLENGAQPCGLAARDTLRLEVCYPLYGKELDDAHSPRESSLAWTLKKNDAPFIGKEEIAKREVNTKVIKLSLEKHIPREGYQVFLKEEVIGKVTSGTFSPTLSQGIAMARVKNIKNLQQDDLLIEIRGKKYQAKYHKSAFYAGGIKK
jgi:aminomethyltransferase